MSESVDVKDTDHSFIHSCTYVESQTYTNTLGPNNNPGNPSAMWDMSSTWCTRCRHIGSDGVPSTPHAQNHVPETYSHVGHTFEVVDVEDTVHPATAGSGVGCYLQHLHKAGVGGAGGFHPHQQRPLAIRPCVMHL